jgi:hypothetical protein
MLPTQPRTSRKSRPARPRPTPVPKETQNAIDPDTDEAEDSNHPIGGLGRSLSEIQLDDGLVGTLFHSFRKDHSRLTHLQPRQHVNPKRQRGDVEVFYFGWVCVREYSPKFQSNVPKKKARTDFYIPSVQDVQAAIRSQGASPNYSRFFFVQQGIHILIHLTVKSFVIDLKIIPARQWSSNALKETVNFLGLPSTSGRLRVDLSVTDSLKGSFKTSHHGSIIPGNGELPSTLSNTVCVKQLYYTEAGKNQVRRYGGLEEQSLVCAEALCLDWAVFLLDLTYGFIEHYQSQQDDNFQGVVPQLRFVEAAIAECQLEQKTFLIEEWIDTSKAPFTKYINNGLPVPCVSPNAPAEVLNTANFLCFAQHVQYQVTGGLVYTSDYQGMFIDITGYLL